MVDNLLIREFIGVSEWKAMRYFKILLLCVWSLVITKQIRAETFVRNRQIHSDIDLGCNEPQGNRRWFYRETEESQIVPITAENGSHYEIQPNIAGLRIIDSVESDEGIYIVQGDGGVECKFILNIFGIFSYNSGVKNPSTGNFEQTIAVIDSYAVTVSCDYNITDVSDAIETFVNVDAVVGNINIQECTENKYPYCTNCVACFPTVNNPFRQFIVYPKIESDSTAIVCRVNLGTYYNGKTVDKHLTFSRTTISTDSYVIPYNSIYQFCNNTPGNKTGVILTTEFSEGIPINQMAYSLQELPNLLVEEELNISCQNLDDKGFPNLQQTYEYKIQLSAIPDLPNSLLEERINISYCGTDSVEQVTQTFDCNYQLIGNSEGQPQVKKSMEWELDGTACSESVCVVSGEYTEVNTMDIRALGSGSEEYSLKCYIELNGVEYYKEWNIYLNFKVCITTTERTTTTTTTTIITTTTDILTFGTDDNNKTFAVLATDPIPSGLTGGEIAGITVGAILCCILLTILLTLLGIAVVICYLQFCPASKHIYYTKNTQNGDTASKGYFHIPKSGDSSTGGDITITV